VLLPIIGGATSTLCSAFEMYVSNDGLLLPPFAPRPSLFGAELEMAGWEEEGWTRTLGREREPWWIGMRVQEAVKVSPLCVNRTSEEEEATGYDELLVHIRREERSREREGKGERGRTQRGEGTNVDRKIPLLLPTNKPMLKVRPKIIAHLELLQGISAGPACRAGDDHRAA
jgi:hypothetical protein